MENGRKTDTGRSDLEPVIGRLREIQRKCRTLGSRNEEFPLMEERLGDIVARLEAGEEAGGEPLRYGEMAQQLFPVAHLFESYGFLTVGKEIAHVERSLRDLAPDRTGEEAAGMSPLAVFDEHPPSPKPEAAAAPDDTPEGGDMSASAVPAPVVVALVVLLAAVAAVVAIILLREPVRRDLPTLPPAEIDVTPEKPTAVPPPPTALALLPEVQPEARLAEEVGLARLALGAGDIEAAVDHLSRAALVDLDDTTVVETAQRIVTWFLGAAGGAVGRGQWELAEEHLDRAESISRRFDLDTGPIESARNRFAAMEHFRILEPTDSDAVLSVRGRRVEVKMLDGSTRDGRVHGIEGAALLLEVDRQVGGGTVSYTDPIPLADIRELKVYEN